MSFDPNFLAPYYNLLNSGGPVRIGNILYNPVTDADGATRSALRAWLDAYDNDQANWQQLQSDPMGVFGGGASGIIRDRPRQGLYVLDDYSMGPDAAYDTHQQVVSRQATPTPRATAAPAVPTATPPAAAPGAAPGSPFAVSAQGGVARLSGGTAEELRRWLQANQQRHSDAPGTSSFEVDGYRYTAPADRMRRHTDSQGKSRYTGSGMNKAVERADLLLKTGQATDFRQALAMAIDWLMRKGGAKYGFSKSA